MYNKKKLIYYVISIIGLLFPIGYFLGFINVKIALPAIFTLIGCQQLYNGLFITSKNDKFSKNFSILFGILIIIFVILVLVPKYYF